jgi:hypothetical protein
MTTRTESGRSLVDCDNNPIAEDRRADQGPQRATAGAARWFGRCFYACGSGGLPGQIDCLGRQYVLGTVLKHDFLAATGLYEAVSGNGDSPRRLVCKIGRRMHFCLIPLGWLGRLVIRREVRNLRRCEGIREVPRILARPSRNMYVYEYVEGRSLGEKPALPADFFDHLLVAVQQIHARNLVHFDLHKPGNILLGDEGRPHVIDFQLSLHLGDRFLFSTRLSGRLRRWLQSYDIYHLYKHKRRLQPDLLTPAEERLSRNRSLPLRLHRAIAKPYKCLRRACLRYLHAKGILPAGEGESACPETDPTRWANQSGPLDPASKSWRTPDG